MSNYESWRISYQSSEAAARSAWQEMIRLHHRVNELEAQLSAIGAGGVETLRKAAKPQADRLVALNSLTRYTVGRRGNGSMHTFAHPNGPFLRYAEVEAAMATQARNKKGIEQ